MTTNRETDAADGNAPAPARGRLKIFLGAAPGVGKTYSMLEDAQRRARDGIDVVVALVETHGRQETDALLRGLEILPRRTLLSRERPHQELDVDAVLARRPKLALIDDIAHANAPGSRHTKRYKDVQDILEAGIDVYTTLNVQHLESLNDVIARIARIRVRETLPDQVLEQADEIELIDLPPEDLIERLRQGKVFVPEQAARAISHFFSRGNLTALRELAMRAAAERVDAEMLSYMRAHGVSGPWPTRDRVMVCVHEGALGQKLVRATQRMADRLRAAWIAVHVQTPREEGLKDDAKDRIQETMRLAERLGAEVVSLPGAHDVASELLAYARQRNVSRIVVGRPRTRGLRQMFKKSVTHTLVDQAKSFEVMVVGNEEDTAPDTTPLAVPGLEEFKASSWKDFGLATLSIVFAGLLAAIAEMFVPLQTLAVIFVLPVLLTAVRVGLIWSIYVSLLGFEVYNFFFTEPRFTIAIENREDLFVLSLYLAIALLTGNIASRVRDQARASRQAARRTARLYEFSQRVAGAAGRDDVLWAVVHHVASTLQCRSLVLLAKPKSTKLTIEAGYPPEDELTENAAAAADWSWKHGKPAGWSTDTLQSSEWLFVPLRTASGIVGLLGVAFDDGTASLNPEQRRLLDAVADQAAVAIERTNLAASMQDARVLTETEQLRSALLSSISHDLRTPLVSIIGSATSLVNFGDKIPRDSRHELLRTILEEAERLNRFVQNLLDMTRLGYGALQPKRDWTDLRDIVGRALERLKRALDGFNVSIDIAPDLPLLFVDPVLMEQVLLNLLENAAKYSGGTDRIYLRAFVRDNKIVIRVTDEGPGIPENERELVFDMFYRVKAGDTRIAGTGLGLAICRGLMQAHGGTIAALAGEHGRGTTIELSLPRKEMPGAETTDEKSASRSAA
ncbi:MAG: two-component sensor histidine kinase [Rhodospirillales bacterium]|nr:two-component sensor histidine kinase [Rhodospirillales bacterium]